MIRGRIAIYEITETVTDGRAVYGRAELSTYRCYADVRDLYGKELYEALELGLKNTAVFRVRYCRTIREICRDLKKYVAVWDGEEYNLYAHDSGAAECRFVDLKGSLRK